MQIPELQTLDNSSNNGPTYQVPTTFITSPATTPGYLTGFNFEVLCPSSHAISVFCEQRRRESSPAPSGKERDDAGSSPSQGRRQSPNRPDYKVGMLSTSNLGRSKLNQPMVSNCLQYLQVFATAAPVSNLLDWPVW